MTNMKQTRILMDMPIIVEIIDDTVSEDIFTKVYSYFDYIDKKFSTFKNDSEITQINNGKISQKNYSSDMQLIFSLAQKTKKDTNGYFDINRNGKYDPLGIVKGWAIWQASKMIKKAGFKNFYVDAGGDIQVCGNNKEEKPWRVGIKNPFNRREIIKVLNISDLGVATSGTYIRGEHIFNPKTGQNASNDIVSLTVVGPNVYEADRFATAAFAMGKKGIEFISRLNGFEGYMIDEKGLATFTGGFINYEIH